MWSRIRPYVCPIAFRGATCWEAALGPFWIAIPYWRFLTCGARPRAGIDLGDA